MHVRPDRDTPADAAAAADTQRRRMARRWAVTGLVQLAALGVLAWLWAAHWFAHR